MTLPHPRADPEVAGRDSWRGAGTLHQKSEKSEMLDLATPKVHPRTTPQGAATIAARFSRTLLDPEPEAYALDLVAGGCTAVRPLDRLHRPRHIS